MDLLIITFIVDHSLNKKNTGMLPGASSSYGSGKDYLSDW